MENWNEWSWLAIPLTVWPLCWLFVTIARGGEPPSESTLDKLLKLRESTWKVTYTKEDPSKDKSSRRRQQRAGPRCRLRVRQQRHQEESS